MEAAVAAEADGSDLSEGDDDSPLTSPPPSPPASPTLTSRTPSPSPTPTHHPIPGSTSLPTDGISKASFRQRKRSHKNWAKRRQAEARDTGYAPHRESIERALQKHVKPSNPVKTKTSIQATNMASTGYVGLRKQNSKKVYALVELVGEGSKFHFQLVPWDGMYVDPCTLACP
jgi:hypothetical protein